jgi:Glycosyltransferase family 87
VPDEKNPLASAKRRGLTRLFIAGILCLQAIFFVSLRERIEQGYPDFAVFYTAAKILRAGLGHQLYAARIQNQFQKGFTGDLPSRPAALPYIHPPFEALFFLPLSRLSYRRAFITWDLLNLAMLVGVILVLRSRVGILRLISPWEAVLCALAFFPIFECLLQGQDSIMQLLFCVLGWKALKKEADVLAGCWFALAAFKFQLMLPIALLVAIWRRRQVLIGFGAVGAVLAAISVALVGWHGLLQYPAFATRVADTPSLGGVPPDFLPNLHGLIMGWPFRLIGIVGTAVVLLISVGLFLYVAARGRKPAGYGKDYLCLSLAVGAAELIGWQTNIHDFTLLLLPIVLVADHCLHSSSRWGGRWSLLYPVFVLLLSPVWFVMWLSIGKVNLMAIPLLWWIWELSQESSRSHSTAEVKASLSLITPGTPGSR